MSPDAVVWGPEPAVLTRADLDADVLRLRHHVPYGSAAELHCSHAAVVLAAMHVLDGWASRVYLGAGARTGPTTDDTVVLHDSLAELVPGGRRHRGETEARIRPPGKITTTWRLATSGTTGTPRSVDHSLASLARTVRETAPGNRCRRWGLLYPPTRMAGAQVLLQVLRGGDVLLDATTDVRLTDRLAWLAAQGVDALSATPTTWRQILQSAVAGSLRLSQVTLGGELADQRLLDALSAAFPARVTHIYASTEAGVGFAVHDGREGFPRRYLDANPNGVRLQIVEGMLFVEAPGSSAAGPDGLVPTGDLAEIRGDRVHVVGRASGVVNIAGQLVRPEDVEAAIRAHPQVADVVVVPRRNHWSGWILTATVAVVPRTPEAAVSALPASVCDLVRRRYTRAHVPAHVEVVATLETSTTGKAARR